MFTWGLLPFRRYADFSGRSRRKEFWFFVLFNYALVFAYGIAAAVVLMVLGFEDMGGDARGNVFLILCAPYVLYQLYAMIPGLAVTVRRLHDLDKSGWWILLGLIPLVGPILLIVWYASEGTPGPNRYGADPLAGDVAQAFA